MQNAGNVSKGIGIWVIYKSQVVTSPIRGVAQGFMGLGDRVTLLLEERRVGQYAGTYIYCNMK